MASAIRDIRPSPVRRNTAKRQRLPLGALPIVVAAFWCAQAQAVFTVGPVADSACQYHDIQAAVDAAHALGGPDVIQVSQGTYPAQSTITVTDTFDLHIEGGFESCSSGNRVGRSTLDAQGAPGDSLIVDTGSGSLTLMHLTLQNASTAGPGGGVYAVGAGPLALYDVIVYFNHAAYGGGLFVSGSDTVPMTLTLIDADINSNSADVNGGGIDVSNTDVTIVGNTHFLTNLANGGDGGAIWAIDSSLHVTAHSPIPNAFIGFNSASGKGGGVYFGATRGSIEFDMANDSASAPLALTHNTAQLGGALYMDASGTQVLAYASFRDVIIDANRAMDGVALYARAAGPNTLAELHMDKTRPGDIGPACAAGLECNAIRDHQQLQSSTLIVLRGTSEAVAAFDMERGYLHDNAVEELIHASQAVVRIDGSLLTSNVVSADLIDVSHSNTTRVANSTIANNAIGGPEVVVSTLSPALVELFNDIADQPGKVLESVLDNGTLDVHDVLLSPGTTLGSGSGLNVQQGLPKFIDPAAGNFHIAADSAAIDRSAASTDAADPPPTFDLDNGERPRAIHSTTTPYDFGAYEYGALVDKIFTDGFDG